MCSNCMQLNSSLPLDLLVRNVSERMYQDLIVKLIFVIWGKWGEPFVVRLLLILKLMMNVLGSKLQSCSIFWSLRDKV